MGSLFAFAFISIGSLVCSSSSALYLRYAQITYPIALAFTRTTTNHLPIQQQPKSKKPQHSPSRYGALGQCLQPWHLLMPIGDAPPPHPPHHPPQWAANHPCSRTSSVSDRTTQRWRPGTRTRWRRRSGDGRTWSLCRSAEKTPVRKRQ